MRPRKTMPNRRKRHRPAAGKGHVYIRPVMAAARKCGKKAVQVQVSRRSVALNFTNHNRHHYVVMSGEAMNAILACMADIQEEHDWYEASKENTDE